jgi:hypothetical protein
MRQVIRRFLKHLAAEKKLWFFESVIYWSVYSVVTPHKLERPPREEEVHETHAHHRHSLRRARRTSGG